MGVPARICLSSSMLIIGFAIGCGFGYVLFHNSGSQDSNTSVTPTSGTTLASITRPEDNTRTTENSELTMITHRKIISTFPVHCPPRLPPSLTESYLINISLSNLSTIGFEPYSFVFRTPDSITRAIIIFHMTSVSGSWCLDDVLLERKLSPDGNLIDSADFENGNLGLHWQYCDLRYPSMPTGTVNSICSHSGNYGYQSQDHGAGSSEYLTQIVNIQENMQYRVEFYLQMLAIPNLVTVSLAFF